MTNNANGNLPLNEEGKIKKNDLMKHILKDMEPLTEKQIRKSILTFLNKEMKKSNVIALNARSVNYTMVFNIKQGATPPVVANHIVSFLKDSSFLEAPYDENLDISIPTDDLKQVSLINVKDVVEEDNGDIGLFIGSTYFKLFGANWILENVKGDVK